ncbi:hypothetical protein [Clostridium drakei]|nr:hypothetical protein [Clostridium drakei]
MDNRELEDTLCDGRRYNIANISFLIILYRTIHLKLKYQEGL